MLLCITCANGPEKAIEITMKHTENVLASNLSMVVASPSGKLENNKIVRSLLRGFFGLQRFTNASTKRSNKILTAHRDLFRFK
jgi:hypothetical protein